MWNLLGSLVSGGASLLGGMFGQQNQEAINQQNIAAQQQINAQNIAESEKMAQNSVQWRVADAQKAGINPLAALGAPSFSAATAVAPVAQSSNSFGAGIGQFGQNIGRAIQATASPEEQAVAAEKTRLDLEGMQLDNDLRRTQLMSSLRLASQPGSPPGIPHKPVEAPSDVQIYSDPSDREHPIVMPSQEAQRSMWGQEDETSAWWWRHVAPAVAGYNIPSGVAPAAPGRSWYLNPYNRKLYQLPDVRKIKPNSGGMIDTTGMWNPFGF